MNGYKKTLLGFGVVSLSANAVLAVRPTVTYDRKKALAGVVGATLNLFLVWNA